MKAAEEETAQQATEQAAEEEAAAAEKAAAQAAGRGDKPGTAEEEQCRHPHTRGGRWDSILGRMSHHDGGTRMGRAWESTLPLGT